MVLINKQFTASYAYALGDFDDTVTELGIENGPGQINMSWMTGAKDIILFASFTNGSALNNTHSRVEE
jgi:hypothetical protein